MVYLEAFLTKIQYGYTDSAKNKAMLSLRITDIQEGRVPWSSVPISGILVILTS